MPNGKTRIWRLKRDFKIFALWRRQNSGRIMISSLANALVAKPLTKSRGWVCQRCSLQFGVRWQSSTPRRSGIINKPSTQGRFTIKKRTSTQRRLAIKNRPLTQRRLSVKNKVSTQGGSTIEKKPYYITSPIFYVNAGKASQA